MSAPGQIDHPGEALKVQSVAYLGGSVNDP